MEMQGYALLGHFDGAMRYVPAPLDAARVEEVVGLIAQRRTDTGPVRRALLELWLTTKHERLSAEDRDAKLMIFASRIADYPEAAVIATLQALSHRCDFFPSWAELAAALDAYSGWRGQLRSRLRSLSQPRKDPHP